MQTFKISKKFQSNNWSGGVTTQLFIYPPKADYQQLNFSFRISTATVTNEKSDFTILPGVSRKLMVLDGEITLYHENHHTKQLHKFDIDIFEGAWKTSSHGKCTDFNLMTTGKTIGELEAVIIKKSQHLIYPIESKWNWLIIYVYSGNITVFFNKKKHTIPQGNLLALNEIVIHSLELEGTEKSELIISKISV